MWLQDFGRLFGHLVGGLSDGNDDDLSVGG